MSIAPAQIEMGLQKMLDEIYHATHVCSKHSLDTIAEYSPNHLDWSRKYPRTPTEAMRFGSAFHTFMLEPDEFTSRHPIAPKCSAVLKSGKNKGKHCSKEASAMFEGAGYCGVHEPDGATELTNALSRKEYEDILGMSAAIHAQPSARLVMQKNDSEDDEEVAIFTERDVNGYPLVCKGKIDIWRPRSLNAMADIKTTTNASPAEFARDIENMAYHRQAAFYFDLCEAIGKPVETFILIAIEKSPPYGCACYTLAPNSPSVEVGRDENRRLMETYARCEQSGYWPSYAETFEEIALPPAAIRRALQRD